MSEDQEKSFREVLEMAMQVKDDTIRKAREDAEAIRTACQLAGPGDVVLVAGKGHEPYQEIQGVKHHFDDREQLLEVFDAEK